MSTSPSNVQAGIPTLWHPALLRALQPNLVAEGLVTKEYEGEIKGKGDTVRILTTSDPAVVAVDRNGTISDQNLTLAGQTLTITEENGFSYRVNDLDVVQSGVTFVEEQSNRAAFKLKQTRDTFIFSTMAAAVAVDNQLNLVDSVAGYDVGTSPGDTDAFELLNRIATVLDESYTPDSWGQPNSSGDVENSGFRFAALPPFYAEMLLNDPRKTSFGTSENLRSYGERYIGRHVSGLELFKTTELPTSNSYHVLLAGWSKATAFAAQVTKFETQRVQGAFADRHMGLDVYGAKVLRPDNLASALVKRA